METGRGEFIAQKMPRVLIQDLDHVPLTKTEFKAFIRTEACQAWSGRESSKATGSATA